MCYIYKFNQHVLAHESHDAKIKTGETTGLYS